LSRRDPEWRPEPLAVESGPDPPRARRFAMTTQQTLTPRSDRSFFVFNALVSCAALAFIAFILFRQGGQRADVDLRFLPGVNAVFNALSATSLVLGYVAIRRGSMQVHRLFMVAAFAFSTLFLIGYLSYHFVHGDTKFTGTGSIRLVYFFVLISHIVLSISVVPLALTSFYFAFTRSFARHRRLNRVFLPIWLYVSVTGVVIFAMLRGI
jgi:putative membrane protein